MPSFLSREAPAEAGDPPCHVFGFIPEESAQLF